MHVPGRAAANTHVPTNTFDYKYKLKRVNKCKSKRLSISASADNNNNKKMVVVNNNNHLDNPAVVIAISNPSLQLILWICPSHYLVRLTRSLHPGLPLKETTCWMGSPSGSQAHCPAKPELAVLVPGNRRVLRRTQRAVGACTRDPTNCNPWHRAWTCRNWHQHETASQHSRQYQGS